MASLLVRAGLFLSGLAAWILAIALGILGKWRAALGSALFAMGADLVGRGSTVERQRR